MRPRSPLRQPKTGNLAFTKVFAPVKKSDLRDAIVRELQQELARQAGAAAMARDEAISEESRAENKWDTHSQEAAYLAEGQARLAADVVGSIELYRTLPLPDFSADAAIALGAVVEVEAVEGNRPTRYFIGPRAGGLELEFDGHPILVLTPQSPLGRQLVGRRAGESIQAVGRGRPAALQIVAVR